MLIVLLVVTVGTFCHPIFIMLKSRGFKETVPSQSGYSSVKKVILNNEVRHHASTIGNSEFTSKTICESVNGCERVLIHKIFP